MITPKRFLGSSGPLSAGRSAFYRLRQVTATEEPASVVGTPAPTGSGSVRVAEAQMRAEHRVSSQRDTLRPLGLAVIAADAAGVALAALQPRGAAGLAVGGAVWMAVARLPLALAITLGAAMTVALDVASALAGSSSSAVLASTLLCALIGLIAYFLKQARESQDRTEVLLAQLEDAREQQTRAAAIAERGRIASELHDVLAHSLSEAGSTTLVSLQRRHRSTASEASCASESPNGGAPTRPRLAGSARRRRVG